MQVNVCLLLFHVCMLWCRIVSLCRGVKSPITEMQNSVEFLECMVVYESYLFSFGYE